MPGRCSAFNCRNTFKNVKHKTNKVTFHSFPKRDPKRIKEWVGQMKWKDWQPTPHSLLCSEHFEERCMDRTGQTVRLRDDAIPTIFAFPSHLQKKVFSKLRQFPEDPVPEESTQREKSPPTYLNHSIWHPSRFHDDYCVPQIKEKWDWLTMDVKGPFPETKSRHKFVLTVMDYYSKWMEAYPMKTNNSKEIAKIISDLISRFGFPVGILSCLTRAHILEVRDKLTCQLIFYRPLGVSLDPVTKSLVDRLVSDLVKEHPDRWDVYLAASVFSFCCKEHPTTRQIPLSLLRCGGTQSVSTSPRKLPVSWRLPVTEKMEDIIRTLETKWW
uniref:THAP-type domain-containing protein n=1 Tax=Oncorhynchus mykiss TaxID=8022 RepID=A0A8K9X261_ONCMY